jgi:hypothetical protein
MPEVIGQNGPLLLVVASGPRGVVVDAEFGIVVESGEQKSLKSARNWSREITSELSSELSSLVASILEPKTVTASGSSLYTVPKSVKAEAEKALKWHKEHKRGGTPVGMNTARTLAKGGQIGIEKIRHIAKYFPRHEVDKKGKGWAPGEDNFPSNGRIAWALWGGDAAWRWAADIVERENKKKSAVTADGFINPEAVFIDPLMDFKRASSEGIADGAEFIARVRMDGSGIDRLYKVDVDGAVYVWDGGCWEDLGSIDGDIWTYDKSLDDPYDTIEKSHIAIDPESAIQIAARFDQNPYTPVSVFDLDADEARLMRDHAYEIDFELIDSVVTAAGAQPDAVSLKSTKKSDGNYTPEERSAKATAQARDAFGKFIPSNGRVTVGGDSTAGGNVTGTNEDGTVSVHLDNGRDINIDPKLLHNGNGVAKDTSKLQKAGVDISTDEPLDVSGILGQPRTPIDQDVQLPGTLPRMTASDLHDVLYNWDSWVQSQRDAFDPLTDKEVVDYGKERYGKDKRHPLTIVDDNGNVVYKGKGGKSTKSQAADPAVQWAVGLMSSGEPEVAMTPDTSDVQPFYMAIVAEDDPRAVLKLVAMVPATNKSTSPMTYKREDAKWVKDEQILTQMKSATPPPVVPLDADVLQDVLKQVDGIITASIPLPVEDLSFMVLFGPNPEVMAIIAAGGADRNRGNAEKLRRYWVHGEGAAKIRWGQGGDWKRCVRHLSKYMGVRAKGYCQLRHKEALGIYTSTHAKRDRARNNSAEEFLMEEVWGKNIGTPTEVTDEDMLMPIEDIQAEQDKHYDDSWTPRPEIVEACKELAEYSDEEFEALVSAGGLDRNRGNAEELRRYWTVGKGAAKIRWGTGGDWTRCVRNLSKYMGPRSKGYCALRHKEMTGVWTGDKKHRQIYGRKRGMVSASFSNELLNATNHIVELSAKTARAVDARERVLGMTAAGSHDLCGAKFHIPLVIPEGVESGDGRKFRKGSITMRELPLPLLWQIKTADGHMGSVVVGRIDHMERTADGIGNAHGVFDSGAYGQEAERLVRNGFIRGISADMDQFEAEEAKPEASEDGDVKKDKLIINKARVMAATIVPKPAFQQCSIFLQEDEGKTQPQEETVIPDGVYAEDVDPIDAAAIVACGYVAGAIPLVPPTDWFDNPKLTKATPLTVTDDGQVYGHIAAWHVDHIGLAYGTKPPRSRSNYSYFHTGVVRTEDGTDVPVGQLTLAGGHAPLEASAQQAVKHYDDTASAFADVHAGEDAYGIWVAGSLRPGTSPEQVRAIRASAPSGDWRPIKGSLELVAVCQVNVPGFPIARARVASGSVMALVAAGASTLAKLKSDPLTELNERLSRLENFSTTELNAKAESAKALFAEVRAQRNSELSARAAELSSKLDAAFSYEDDFTYISRRERKGLAEQGQALPDGSFPIRNVDDLKNAISSYGRASASKRGEVQRFIMKRAKQLRRTDMIPQEWKDAANAEFNSKIQAMRAKAAEVAVVAAGPQDDAQGTPTPTPNPTPSVTEEEKALLEEQKKEAERLGKAKAAEPQTPEQITDNPSKIDVVNDPTADGGQVVDGKYVPGKTQPRDENGQFRKVLARLKQDLGTAGLQKIAEEARTVEGLHEVGNYSEAAKAAGQLIDTVDRLDSGALNKVSLENVRNSAAELGKVIANLPLGFTDQTQKLRYSDLPPALQTLMDEMMTRVEDKIGKEDAAIATEALRGFKSGSDVYSQAEISSQMSKLLRLLT